MANIIELHYNGELGYNQSIQEVINFFKSTVDENDFLDFEKDGKSNRERIFNTYDVKTKIKQNLSNEDGEDIKNFDDISLSMPCPVPMVFFIDANFITKDIITNQGSLLANNFSVTNLGNIGNKNSAFTAYDNKFYNENIKKLPNNDNAQLTNTVYSQRQLLKPTVWVWCKSLNEDGKFNSNSIFNLTPFIMGINTNNTETGGNWSLNLLPIEGMIDVKAGEPIGYWHPDKTKYIKFKKDDIDNFHFRNILNLKGLRKQTNEDYYDKNSTFGKRYQNTPTNNLNQQDVKTIEDDFHTTIRSEILFKNMISENDVIFISFIGDNEVETTDDFFISHDKLKDRNWDMIGLVDTNSTGITFENSDSSSDISGRDLMKLLLEDGTYFFAKSFSKPDDSDTVFNNIDLPNSGDEANTTNNVINGKGKSINRLVTTGMIDMLFNQEARNVHFVMNLLISRLANIEICHSRLFEYYGDKRTKFSIPTYETIRSEEEPNEDINRD